MSYLTQAKATGDEDLRARVMACLQEICSDVAHEDPGTTNHAQRVAYAERVRDMPWSGVDAMIWSVVQNPTVAAALTDDGKATATSDGDIKFICASQWDAVAARVIGPLS